MRLEIGSIAPDFVAESTFDLVPDVDKTIFRAYGVERGLRGFVSPTVMRE